MAALSEVEARVREVRVLEHGFVALFDRAGRALFSSSHAPSELAEFREGAPEGWRVERMQFDAWGFTVVGAVADADVRGRVVAVLVDAYWLLALLGLVALAAIWRASRTFARALERLRDSIGRVADRDLTHGVTLRSEDEVGQIGGAVNRAISSMRGVLRSIRVNAESLSGTASELSGLGETLRSNTLCTTEKAETATKAAARVREQFDAVAAATEEMSATIRDVAERTAEAASTSDAARAMADQASELVAALDARSKAISGVVDTITNLAEQTNLLALNATIESARAGEAGRGFAVVAAEVKSLAGVTAGATADIARQIQEVQSATASSVNLIGQVGDAVGRMNEIAASVAAAVEEQLVATREIAHSVADGAREAGEMDENVADLAGAAQGAARATARVVGVVHGLESTSSVLEGLVHQFQVGNATDDDVRLERAKSEHGTWLRQLQDLVAGRLPADDARFGSSTECHLGQWHDGPGRQRFAGIAHFDALASPHGRLHAIGEEIVDLMRSGGPTADARAADRLREAENLSREILSRLDALQAVLESARTGAAATA